jgi:hypothetical protein
MSLGWVLTGSLSSQSFLSFGVGNRAHGVAQAGKTATDQVVCCVHECRQIKVCMGERPGMGLLRVVLCVTEWLNSYAHLPGRGGAATGRWCPDTSL